MPVVVSKPNAFKSERKKNRDAEDSRERFRSLEDEEGLRMMMMMMIKK